MNETPLAASASMAVPGLASGDPYVVSNGLKSSAMSTSTLNGRGLRVGACEGETLGGAGELVVGFDVGLVGEYVVGCVGLPVVLG